MSQLGGFEYVFQIRRDKLLDLIQDNVTVQGKSLATPFRLSLEGPPSGLPPRRLNSVDLLVKSLDLSLDVGTAFCTLTLRLEGGVIRLSGAPEAAFLGGAVNIRMQLVDGTLIAARPLEATLDAPANGVIAGIENFAARANSEVNKLINAERNKDFDLYPDAGLVKQILVIFSHNRNLDADTFCAFIGSGNAESLTPTVDAKNSVSLAIAPDVVTAVLPDANKLSNGPVTVTRVNYGFHDGFIDVDGEFDGDDTCWSIDGGTFTQRFFPSLVSQNVVFTPQPLKPELSYHLEIEFLCELALLVLNLLEEVLNPLTIIYGPYWAKSLGIKLEFVPPDTANQTQPALTLGGVTWSAVTVSPEGLILTGDRTGGGVVSQVQLPAIHVRTKDEPQNVQARAQGSVTVQAVACDPRSFDYVESIQDDQNTLTVESEWLFEPIKYSWTVNGQALQDPSEVIILGGGFSALEYTGTVKTALPPPNGTAIPGHAIRLQYKANGLKLVLRSRNEDANYDIRVEVRATDALGRVFTDAVNLTMVGDVAEFDPEYDKYLDRCIKAAADLVNKKGRKQGGVKPGVPEENWRAVLDVMMQQFREGNAEAAALIPGLMKAVGINVVGKALTGKVIGP